MRCADCQHWTAQVDEYTGDYYGWCTFFNDNYDGQDDACPAFTGSRA